MYKKVQEKPGPDFVEVFMYYWDSRDGPSFEGWWFGNKLGGTQVWSHNASQAMVPPGEGWKIPWDGAVRTTLVVISKELQAKQEAEGKLQEATAEVTSAQTAAKNALEEASASAGDFSSTEGCTKAEQILVPQQPLLQAAMKRLVEMQRTVQGDSARNLILVRNQLQATMTSVAAELNKIRQGRQRAQIEERTKEMVARERKVFEDMKPEALEKCNAAEDAVEKASITSEMIQAAGDSPEEVAKAVDETEAKAREAQAAIGAARLYLNSKQSLLQRLQHVQVRDESLKEFARMNMQLTTAQNKLNPLKTARQDFLQRQQAKQAVTEIMEALSPAELEVDAAEEANKVLEENSSKETLALAQQALRKANDHLAMARRMVLKKKVAAGPITLAEIAKLEERLKKGDERLAVLRDAQKELAERSACEGLIKEATDKLATVTEAVSKAADAEAPFLMGVEELPTDETLAAVKACEAAATSANTAVSIARMFIATKLVEAKRFAAGAAKEATEKLQELQRQLQEQTDKLTKVKTAMASRRQAALSREAESQVKGAEELAGRMKEAAAALEDIDKLAEMTPEEVKAHTDEAKKAELAANPALAEARRFITQRQIEAKGKEHSEEIRDLFIKLQTRLSAAQNEVVTARKLAQSVEQRLAAKKVAADARQTLQEALAKVDSAVQAAEALDADDAEKAEKPEEGGEGSEKPEGGEDAEKPKGSGVDLVKAAETALSEGQTALKAFGRWLDGQGRTKALPQEEIAKLDPQVKEAQAKLDDAGLKIQERREQVIVKSIVSECEQRVSEAEGLVGKVIEAEAPLLAGDELPLEEAGKALAALEGVSQEAQRGVGGTKTFISMKRLAAKRLSEVAQAQTGEALAALQARVDASTKKLAEVKRGLSEKKRDLVRREVQVKLGEVEKQVEAAKEATQALIEPADAAPEAMKAACEKAGTSQQQALRAVEELRKRLEGKGAAFAATGGADDAGGAAEKCAALQAELDQQRALLRDQEHRFVAGRLQKEASDMVAGLTEKMAATTSAAACLVDEDFSAGVWLDQITQVFKAKMKQESKDAAAVFASIGAEGDALSSAKFASSVAALPELLEDGHPIFSEEELNAVFKKMAGEAEQCSKQQFCDQFIDRYVCVGNVSMTNQFEIRGGKVVSKLLPNDVLEAMEQPTKDEKTKIMRIKAKAEKDGKEGYVTIAGNQGTPYLEAYSPFAAREKKVAGVIQEMQDATRNCKVYLEKKANELTSVQTGPLAECRMELLNLLPTVDEFFDAMNELRNRVIEAKSRHAAVLEDEKRRRVESKEKRVAKCIIDEALGAETHLQELVDKILPEAEALEKSMSMGEDAQDEALGKMPACEKDLQAATKKAATVQVRLSELTVTVRAAARGPLLDARNVLAKTKVKVSSFETKLQGVVMQLKAASSAATADAHKAVTAALRDHVQREGLSAEALYAELSKGSPLIPAVALRAFLDKMPEPKPKARHLGLGLERYKAGMPKLTFFDIAQEYVKVVKDITVTDGPDLKEGKTLRKMQLEEIAQVLERKKGEDAGNLERVRCIALTDLTEGWITVQGSQGTAFLEPCPKPYYCFEEDVMLAAGPTPDAAPAEGARRIKAGEVLELREGPRVEEPRTLMRVECKSAKDGKKGWITLKAGDGPECTEKVKVFCCMRTIAITQDFAISGKALRKLEVGEVVDLLEDPKDDEKKKMSRGKIKTRRDGKEGWVTIKGNQGTAFLEESQRHHAVQRAVPLEREKASGGAAVRMLEVGEVVELLGEPFPETEESLNRMRGRNPSDGTEGWFTLAQHLVRPWVPAYTCAISTPLTIGVSASSTAHRAVGFSEALEALDVPVLDSGSGLVRCRVKAVRDGTCGFATLRDKDSVPLLVPRMDGD